MASRIAIILRIADESAAALIDYMKDGTRAKSNTEAISTICRALVQRKTPLLPTAKLVSEEGSKNNPHFPSERTIFNSYSRILKVWKKTYYDVMNINSDGALPISGVGDIDTSQMNNSTADLVDRLKAIVGELTQRCNALKKIIDEQTPPQAAEIDDGMNFDQAVANLERWLLTLYDGPFQVDENGVQVSRRTPPGTRIMSSALLLELRSFTDSYSRLRSAQEATASA